MFKPKGLVFLPVHTLSVTTPLETILNVASREDTTYHIEKSEIICQSVDKSNPYTFLSGVLTLAYYPNFAQCLLISLHVGAHELTRQMSTTTNAHRCDSCSSLPTIPLGIKVLHKHSYVDQSPFSLNFPFRVPIA
jgi:hypothetical protein